MSGTAGSSTGEGVLVGSAAFYTSLNCGALGLNVGFDEAVELAAEFGFGGVDPNLSYLQEIPEEKLGEVQQRLAGLGLRWGSGGMPVSLIADAPTFASQLAELERNAGILAAAGVERVGTWIRPMDDSLTYRRNFARFVERVGLVDEILASAGLRFGLEYVGPKTMWTTERYPFIHTLAETLDLLNAVGSDNVGIVLDTYHWYTANETAADLAALPVSRVVAADVNDAHQGRERNEQQDLDRCLPASTGVIDIAGFLGALTEIGFAGPIKVEPFSKELKGKPAREVVEKTAASLRAAGLHS